MVLADNQRAWDYYTQPKHICQWNYATDDWQCPSASNDLQVGGKFIARMEAKDRSFGFDFEGTYTEISTGKKLCYSLADGRKVEVTFENRGLHCQVKVIFDAETENPIEMQKNGWQAILDKYKKHVDSK